jgi:hypothetical protein
MGLAAWLDLDGRDIVAFVFAGLLGYLAGRLVPLGWWSIYVSILVSYHLFLAWLVLTAEHDAGLSLPIVSTIVTHLAFMILVVTLGLARHVSPLFSYLRYAIAALAIFERGWLFQANPVKPKEPEVVVPTPKFQSTAEDEEAWLRYVAQQKPGSRKTGASLRAEYEQWMLARTASRSGVAANDRDPAGR